MGNRFSPGLLAQAACILEVTARKPGNVHRLADFDDLHYLDLLLSASAIVEAMDRARTIGVGASVLIAVEATRRLVSTNTNLGIILLLAPLAAVPGDVPIREGVVTVLDRLTIDDARLAFRAIRQAAPGGLDAAPQQDVRDEPTETLREAMRLASGRDLIARQYSEGYPEIFDVALPALNASRESGRPLETAILFAHLSLMSRCPDTLIARKRGPAVATEAARLAADVLDRGWPDRAGKEFSEFDAWLRADGHARNPGATADAIAATLFIALREGTIEWPKLDAGREWGHALMPGPG